ncbi:ABC transporter substrate-binding protein [Synechococcus sp. CS-1325]|uniref:CmpA/NrtA family ABC transporter substrate-binding protein n=1 Tax=unclassified Synechococcus TaxID=2626047 RepID=UPI000DAF4E22|nr:MULTISPECIES: CmpA/NrtA family ABC transporter substrate-binding protein [unclassified Synechococcus]MCT0198448.1 ABC transporter substrate-binding protein [Synechococcus sp. CS-1325]MCT0213568.1 ABC transporter substrate-binding protein [Synechococcus sp. CS-1326]MCT0232159.1 ABC transporter substrate-binding protein [Synechococcus sp. CS-1327]PZV01725.1 MAG: bicarbonate-binding protein [Cyanobium sp.]
MTRRRRFLALMGSAMLGTSLLAGCTGNPPDSGGGGASAPAPATADKGLETKTINLGFIPILEAAPLVVAVEKGYFAKHGLEVNLTKQASWSSARDNVVLGTAGGGIDGGQWQMPMPHMLTEGAISGGKKVPMYVLAMLMSQGNGIAAANAVKDGNLSVDLKKTSPGFFDDFAKKTGNKFKASYTFPKANQEIWIRYWLAAGGVDPDKDVELLTVPATETLQGMKNGTMQAFSTGDPWPSRIVKDKVGYLAAITAQIWKSHPEEFLAVRADWVDKHPKAAVALIKGLIEAQIWMDKAENRAEVATILSSRKWHNIPAPVLEEALKGQYKLGADMKPETDPAMGPLYWASDRGVISYPYESLSLWFLLESIRWKFYPGVIDTVEQAKALNEKVVREDLWITAAKELGLPAADIPTSTSRGKETFFDGVIYDPENPQAYLDSLKIKK